jgi:hypothetical protein
MSFGRNEDVECDSDTRLSALETKVANYFEIDHEEWKSMTYSEKESKTSVYRKMNKKEVPV